MPRILIDRRVVAIIPFFLLGIAAGWQAYGVRTDTAQFRLATDEIGLTLANAHELATRQEGSGVDFSPDRFEAYNKVVERRVGVKLNLSALENTGLTFQGGSLLPIYGHPAAQLLFTKDDEPVSLVVVPNLEGVGPERIGSAMSDMPVLVATRRQYAVSSIGWAPGPSAKQRLRNLVVLPDEVEARLGQPSRSQTERVVEGRHGR